MDKKSGDLVDMIHNTGIFQQDPLSEIQRFLISIDLVSGLEELQQDPYIVHNDIKPENCLYDLIEQKSKDKQRAKGCLGDFGSAKDIDPKKS